MGSRNRGLCSGTGYLTERQPNFGKELGQKAFLGKRKKKKGKQKEEIKASPRSLSPPQFLSHAETHNTRQAQRENNPGLLETSGFQQLFKNEIETLQNFHQAAGGVQSLSPRRAIRPASTMLPPDTGDPGVSLCSVRGSSDSIDIGLERGREELEA